MSAKQYLNGPDQIIPATELSTIIANGAVKLRLGDSDLSALPPTSVPGLFKRVVRDHGDRVALAYKENDSDVTYKKITYREYLDQVRIVSKAFLKLGLERFNSVGLLGFNSPEWFISYFAAIHAGGMTAGVYTTNSPDACYYCLVCSRANIVVVEDEIQLKKILEYKDSLPLVKAIIQYRGTPTEPGVYSWDDILKLGMQETDERLDEVLRTIAVNQCCALIFTSGTVGNPKAVMLSHDNVVWDAKCVGDLLNITNDDVVVSYLPLSHVAAQLIDMYSALNFACCVYFANKDALKGSLVKTLQEVRPTRFLAVPRVWEKIYEKMRAVAAQNGPMKRALATWAKNQGLQRNMDLMKGIDRPSIGYCLAKTLIFSKVKANLGFDRCVSFFCGAAPLSTDIKKYFASLDILIQEGFGMSEVSGAHTINTLKAFRFDSQGRTLPGTKTRIDKPDDEKHGEICLYGRHVFMGYLNDRAKTDETIDNDGWVHSGDIGKVDEFGFLYITGRIKELIITAGGENVAPVIIEQNIKTELPMLGHAVVIGDKRKFLSVLVTLSAEVDSETGIPKEELTKEVIMWLESLSCPYKTITQVMDSGPDKKIMTALEEGIYRANKKAISNAQKIQKVAILPSDFSIPTGELGPSMKLKRNVVSEKFQDIIEKFYTE